MPRARRTSKSLVAAEALTVLTRLAHKGAYAALASPGADAAETCPIYSPGNGFAEPVAQVSRPAIVFGVRKGWLAAGEGGTLRISAAGMRALRTAKSGAPGPASPSPRVHAAARSQREGALAWLRRRKDSNGRPLITEVQFSAGEMLAAAFWHAQMSSRVTASWSVAAPVDRQRRATPGLGVEMRDAVVAARQRFQRALDAVGPELAGILVDVCCHDLGLEASGEASGWPQRAAKVVLDLALTRLARHYGLLPPERPAATRLRHWGDTDYRPTLESWR